MLLFKNTKLRLLSFGKNKTGGRNKTGKITSYHRGGGCKKTFRIIDLKKSIWNVLGFVKRIEYDPNRTSFIVLIIYSNGIFCYSIATENLNVGDSIISGPTSLLKNGNSTLAGSVPVGQKVCLFEINPLTSLKLARAAGVFAIIISKTANTVLLKLRSGKIKKIAPNSMLTLGSVSNSQLLFRNFRKAGYYRIKGWRPHVRGVAMNPVDHPHGGGQGKTSGGRPSVTPWGKITKGKPTTKK